MESSVRIFLGLAVAFLAAAVSLSSAADGKPVDWARAERVSDGIELVKLSRSEPRLIKAMAMRVDLANKALFFSANGRDERWGRPMPYYTNRVIRTRRVTAEEFLMNARTPVEQGGRGLDMVAAFNTALWTPCPEPIPTPYAQPFGLNISDGVVVSSGHDEHVRGIFVIWKSGKMDILPTPLPESKIGDVWIAHSGWDVVLKDGEPRFTKEDKDVHPRTALGLSRDRRWFYVLSVEGRHAGVSIGADYDDLADMMLSLGASDAINMDGGGSTELVRWDDASQRQVACFMQEAPPRRDALFIGICRRGGSRRGAADSFEAAIDGDRTRSNGLYHRYEFDDVRDTPPPKGYKPFYITHYGRHGSRYQTAEHYLKPFSVLEAADKAGALDAPGRDLLRRMRPFVEAHRGMFETMTERGAQEHVRLARRMYGRFPSVFEGKGMVRCQSSIKLRCCSSMANFACALKGEAPQLDFRFFTGQRYMDVINRTAMDNSEECKAQIARIASDMQHQYVKPKRIMNLLFKDSPALRKIVGDEHRFVANLFLLATAFQSLECELDGLDIYDFFTRDETIALARYWNCYYYLRMGNSAEFGDRVVAAAENLARDIADRADEAMSQGGVCADLRFGHDSGLFPLAGFLGVEGAGVRVPAAESWKSCPLWRQMPMAANIQMVLYRDDSGDCLVKVLYNEREARLNGLEPACWPYYRWTDFSRLLRRR